MSRADIDAAIEAVRTRGLTGVAAPGRATPSDVVVLWDARAVREGWGTPGLVVTQSGLPIPSACPRLDVSAPARVFAALLDHFNPSLPGEPGIHPSAVVAADARVHHSVVVGPLVVVEEGSVIGPRTILRARSFVGRNVHIGADCRLAPGALVLDGCLVGDGVHIGPGSVLGGRGFGYLDPGDDGVRDPIPQVGRVVVEDGAHIGSLCAIDRGTVGDTVVGAHARLDNHVVVGHNARIGPGAVLVSQVGVSGSAEVGAGAVMAAGAGLTNHRRIGEGAVVTSRAAVYRDVPAGAIYSGSPARPRHLEVREQAALKRMARAHLRERPDDDPA